MPKYSKMSIINSGGQGTVWRGEATDGAEVAIKELTLAGPPDQQDHDRKRFQKEITCQTSLLHENIMTIMAVDTGANPPYFVMPLAEKSLRDMLLPAGTALLEDEAVRIFDLVVDAVAYAHSEGVIHRDIKPENILFRGDLPMLSDFGLGRRMLSGSTTLTVTNAGMGTFAYGAPEQFTDAHAADERADVFALGRVFFEMLSGQFAFLNTDLSLIPSKFRYIVMTATHGNPDKRFATVAEMQRELDLLTASSSNLLAPAELAKTLILDIAAGASGKVPDLARVLIENTEDVQLYLHVFTSTPETVLAAFALKAPTEFREVMNTFDGYADGSHPWSFTDTIATFLRAAFRSTSELQVRKQIMERLLVLGWTHGRYYVRSAFVEVVIDAIRDPAYTPVVVSILRNNTEAIEFVRDQLEEHSLPQVVADLLAA